MRELGLRRTWTRKNGQPRERMLSAAHLRAYWLPLSPSTATAAVPAPRSLRESGVQSLTAASATSLRASFFFAAATMGCVLNVYDISGRGWSWRGRRRARAWRQPSNGLVFVVVG